MPAFVSTSVFPNGTSVVKAVEELLTWGISHIELGSVHDFEQGLLKKLRRFSCTMLTHNFFPPENGRLVLNIASINPKIREESLGFVKRAIDFAEDLGAEIYTLHPGFLTDPEGESQSKENYDFRFPESDASHRHAECFANLLASVQVIEKYLKGKRLRIAFETQGALEKKNVVFWAKPEELKYFFKHCTHPQIGINLNLGHLNLASQAWGFDRVQFVEQIKPRIFAVEVTHNDGGKDDHAPLQADAWYLEILKEKSLAAIPLIFEGRFTMKEDVLKSYEILKSLHG